MSQASKIGTIRVFVLDHLNGYCRDVKEIDANNTLQEMYRLLHCDLVDIREITVEGEVFDIWFDEEFLCKNHPVTATFLMGELSKGKCYPLCGSWLIAKHGPKGETLGLTDEDITKLWAFTDINALMLQVAFARGYMGGN